MKIYHKIQNTFFQIFDFSHIKENRKNGCDIMFNKQCYKTQDGKNKYLKYLLKYL